MPSTPRPSRAKKPQDHKPKTPQYGRGWKSPLTDLELPSGELCQVRRPGVQGLMKAGVLHSLDTLTTIVQTETIPNAEGRRKKDSDDQVKAIMDDPEKFQTMMDQVDKIVIHVVTQPKVLPNRVTQELIDAEDSIFNAKDLDREPTDEEKEIVVSAASRPSVFVDWIDSIDKMYIMNFAVGGTADLAQFRQDTEALVGGVSAGQAASQPTE